MMEKGDNDRMGGRGGHKMEMMTENGGGEEDREG